MFSRGLISLVLVPTLSHAIDKLTLEAGLGMAVPVNTFFDLRSTNGDAIFVAETKIGPSLAVSLLLNDVELRWGMNVYRITDVESQSISNEDVGEVVDVANAVGLCDALDCQSISETLETPDSGFIFVNSLTAGYRFYFSRGDFRPYFPIGIGTVVAAGESASIDRFLFGFGAQSGLGLENTIDEDWSWFLSLRYHISLVEAPTSVAATGIIVGGDAFESTTVLFHAVGINAGVLTGW